MMRKLRSRSLAGAGAVLLVLSMTGLAAAATLVDDTTPATLSTFEDLNGNGIDDDCETAVTANADAVTLAMAAVDANADGVISVTEAAHSSWVGGVNCNHGGYVSLIAHELGATSATRPTPPAPSDDRRRRVGRRRPCRDETSTGEPPVAADCSEDAPDAETADETDAAKDAARAACEAALAAGTPIVVPTMTHVELAQSDVIGGKNCNHGGAVSEANAAAKAERDAAKQAAKDAKQASREAKTHGKANKHNKHGGQN